MRRLSETCEGDSNLELSQISCLAHSFWRVHGVRAVVEVLCHQILLDYLGLSSEYHSHATTIALRTWITPKTTPAHYHQRILQQISHRQCRPQLVPQPHLPLLAEKTHSSSNTANNTSCRKSPLDARSSPHWRRYHILRQDPIKSNYSSSNHPFKDVIRTTTFTTTATCKEGLAQTVAQTVAQMMA